MGWVSVRTKHDTSVSITIATLHLLCVDGGDLEVHRVDGGEDVGGALHDALPGLRHRDGGAPRQEDRLVPGAEGQDPREAALDQNNLGEDKD